MGTTAMEGEAGSPVTVAPALKGERKVSQRPQQHGHDGAERQHASPTSRTVASLVELAPGPNSSWFWSSSPSPNGARPQLVGYRPVLKSWRPGQADELG
jgi:hypothetical protein